MKLVTDVIGSATHAALLDLIAVVEDYMDGIVDTGVIGGASGFDDREWTFDYPRATSLRRTRHSSYASNGPSTEHRHRKMKS